MNNINYLSNSNSKEAEKVELVPAIGNETWRNFFELVSMVLLILYLVFLPSGVAGLGLATASLLLKLITTNSTTRGIYMLNFGMLTLGMISISVGYPGIGGKIGFVIGVSIIVSTTDLSRTLFNLRAPLLWIAWISFILLFFYFYGPMTQYCTDKLVNTVINGILFLVIYYNMFNNRSLEWLDLGQLSVMSSYAFLAAGLIITPELKPDSIFNIGIIRTTFYSMNRGIDILELNNNLSYLASTGIMLMYAASPDRPIVRMVKVKMVIYIILAVIMLSWSSARLPIVATIVASALILFMKPLYKGRYMAISFIFTGLLIVYVIAALSMNLNFIHNVLDSSNPLAARLNRYLNWSSGYERFIEMPFLGYGLGGYFIEGYSFPGSGTYAHNLFLELLSETGIIGTILIMSPLFLWRRIFNKKTFLLRAQNGGLIFSIFVLTFLQSMISFDLKSSIVLFSAIGAMATALKVNNDSTVDEL